MESADVLDDLHDLSNADPLDLHLGDRERHGPLASAPAIKTVG